jgi:hypothetical protein
MAFACCDHAPFESRRLHFKSKKTLLAELEIKYKMAVFWFVEPYSLSEVYRRYRGIFCLHHRGDNYQTTWRNNPENSHIHTRRRETLKYYIK